MGIDITSLIIVIFSAIIHEVSHGLVAEKLGDDTAREAGRITLNPIPHIDPIGTIIMPLLIGFGAAKPVPVNFNNLRNPKWGMVLVSLAGPVSNFLLAILFLIPIKFGLTNEISESILIRAVVINIVLGVFNLIPIPPLDGSKVVAGLGPRSWMYKIFELERYSLFLLAAIFILIKFGFLERILTPIISLFFKIFGLD